MTQKQLFLFWLPLAAMWILMAVEQPLVSGGIARMPEVRDNLAAFGVCFSLALIIEGPIIQMLSAATALSGSRENYRRLLMFMHILGFGLTALHLLTALPPVYRFVSGTLLGVPERLIPLSRRAFLIMTPWTAAIGYRRLWQGVLIKYRKTVAIPLTMAVRLTASLICVLLGVGAASLRGAEMGAMTMSVAVTVGALVTWFFVRPVVRSMAGAEEAGEEIKSFPQIVRFYVPLALTSLISLAARPILTAGISRSPFPVESLAVWPVVTGYLFLFQAPLLSSQEAVIALLDKGTTYGEMKLFINRITRIIGGFFLVCAVTPLARLWFTGPAGLEDRLLSYALSANLAIALIPFCYGFLAWYRGVQISRGDTDSVARAVAVNATVLTLSITLLALLFSKFAGEGAFFSGATAGSLAFTASVGAEMLYLRRAATAPNRPYASIPR